MIYFLKLVSWIKSRYGMLIEKIDMRDEEKDKFKLIKSLEGFRSKSYTDTTGHVTVGYGFNMDSVASFTSWQLCKIPVSFDDVYDGNIELPEEYARVLYKYFWDMAVISATLRSDELGYNYSLFNEFKKFILADIHYNTGSVEQWTKVFDVVDDKEVLYESRRKQINIDGRIAKIGYYFGVIGSVSEARELGLEGAKYIK